LNGIFINEHTEEMKNHIYAWTKNKIGIINEVNGISK